MGEYISSYLSNIFKDKDLNRREREILILLKSFDKENINKVQVKISTLMECIETTNKSGVCKLLKGLKSKGYLDIEKGIGRTASSYRFIKDYMIKNEEIYSERVLTTNELCSEESLTTDSSGKGIYTLNSNSGNESYTTDNFIGEEILTTNKSCTEEVLTTDSRGKGNYTLNSNIGNESYTTDKFSGEEILTTNELSSKESLTTNGSAKENYTSNSNSGNESYTIDKFSGEEKLTTNELSSEESLTTYSRGKGNYTSNLSRGNKSYTTSKDINNKYNIKNNNKNNKSYYINNNLDDVFINILKHWNNQSITSVLQLDLRIRDAITLALRKYSFDAIIKAISNYSEIYYSSYFYNIKWNLNSFLTSQKGIDKFHDNGCMWQKYNQDFYQEDSEEGDVILDKYSYIDV